MTKGFILIAAVGLAAVSSSHIGAAAPAQVAGTAKPQVPTAARAAASADTAATQARAMLDQYCVTCHNQRLKTGGLALDVMDVTKVGEGAATWEKVHNKLRGGLMPPRTAKALPEPVRADLVAWLERSLDRSAAASPNPGRAEIFHRLNRTEYRNAVRDLLALDIDVNEMLPEDDSGAGFDNMASVLKISPSLMDAYMAASQRISRLAVGRGASNVPVELTFPVSAQQPQYEWIDGLPFGTRGGTLITHNFPADADYEISIELGGGRTWYLTETLYALLDGEIVQTIKLPGRKAQTERSPEAVAADTRVGGMAPDSVEAVRFYLEQKKAPTEIAQIMGLEKEDVDAIAYVMANGAGNLYFRIPVKAGPHELAVTFAETVFPVLEGPRKPFETPGRLAGAAVPQPYVDEVKIVGPFNMAGVKDTPSMAKVFMCKPASPAQESACARTIFSHLARRAYRRPVAEKDLAPLLAFYQEGRNSGGTFVAGVEAGLRRMLVSPNFLYRIEIPPSTAASGTTPAAAKPSPLYAISDIALASRLSFFLWSSIPDDQLLHAAERGQLRQPAELQRQVKRMLADPKASALVENFAGQWLKLRSVLTQEPYDITFPDYDTSLQIGLKKELELFFESIYTEDRSVLDLVTADYTFVNDRLARHYGIPNIQGAHFRRVTLPAGSPRVGMLGKGAILLVTSNNARTSPVRRGKWILENILGTPPPAPPPNVPALPERRQGNLKLISMRDRMAQHRANPVCSSCHATIDPLGFALEQFDPIGKYREVDEAFKPIDVAGQMPDGTKFESLAQFRGLLLRQPDMFVASFARRLLQYGLGRELAYYDEPTVRAIVRDAKRSNYRFSSIVMGIVTSQPFKMRKWDTGSGPAGLQAAR